MYLEFLENNVEVLFDDRENATAGEKFNDADLIGIPTRVIISKKTLAVKSVEVKKRNEAKAEMVKYGDVIEKLKN